MGYDSLIADYQDNEIYWSFFMIVIGFSNEVHSGIMLAFATVQALEMEGLYEYSLFTCFVLGVPILARSINAKWWVTYNHRPRIYLVCGAFLVAYALMIAAYLSMGGFDNICL